MSSNGHLQEGGMFFRFSAGLVILALTLPGCMTHTRPTLTQYVQPQPRAQRTCWTAVRVYVLPESIPGQFETVALLKTDGNAFTSENALVKGLRQKAAQMGANGLLLQGTSTGGGMGVTAKMTPAVVWDDPTGQGLAS